MLRFFQFVLIFCCLLLPLPVSAQSQEGEEGNDIFEEVEDLNLGLKNFESIALSYLTTPEQALSYFVRHCREGRYDRAAYVLNLNFIDPRQRAAVGPDLAHKLYLVMDRQTGFPFDKVPDRLDGQLPPAQSNNNPLGGKPRKSILLGSLSLQVGEFEIYLTRYRGAEKTSAWLFSPSTVSGIEEAYELMGPRPWERRVPDWFKNSLLLSTPLWAWLLLGITLVLSSLLARVLTERRVSPTGGRIERLGSRARAQDGGGLLQRRHRHGESHGLEQERLLGVGASLRSPGAIAPILAKGTNRRFASKAVAVA